MEVLINALYALGFFVLTLLGGYLAGQQGQKNKAKEKELKEKAEALERATKITPSATTADALERLRKSDHVRD